MKAKLVNESLEHTNFFGTKVSHSDELQKQIRSRLTDIITSERGISEKAFSDYDSVMAEVKKVCEENSEIYEMAEQFYQEGKRLNWLAEEMYEKYFKKTSDS